MRLGLAIRRHRGKRIWFLIIEECLNVIKYLVSSEHAAQKFEGFFSGPLKALELHDDVEIKTYQLI
jgi:hypothetical protein